MYVGFESHHPAHLWMDGWWIYHLQLKNQMEIPRDRQTDGYQRIFPWSRMGERPNFLRRRSERQISMQLMAKKEEWKTDIIATLGEEGRVKDRYQCSSWRSRRNERQISLQLLAEKEKGRQISMWLLVGKEGKTYINVTLSGKGTVPSEQTRLKLED